MSYFLLVLGRSQAPWPLVLMYIKTDNQLPEIGNVYYRIHFIVDDFTQSHADLCIFKVGYTKYAKAQIHTQMRFVNRLIIIHPLLCDRRLLR